MRGTFAMKYGPWALVTGGSRGLGAEFARQLARRGLNLVLVATNPAALTRRAEELHGRYGVHTRTIACDLGDEDFLDQLTPVTGELEIGLVVSNAAISTVGPFLSQSSDHLVNQLRVNSQAGLVLTRHFAPMMAERGHGGIILLSSGSAQHGTPYSANYAGTKAFNLILAEALWYEFKPLGVDVLGFMAGATRTDGWLANNPKPDRFVPVGETVPAVATALRALGRRPSVANGWTNRLGYAFMGMVSRARAITILGSSMNTMFGPFADKERN